MTSAPPASRPGLHQGWLWRRRDLQFSEPPLRVRREGASDQRRPGRQQQRRWRQQRRQWQHQLFGGGGTTSSSSGNYCGTCSSNADCGGGSNYCLTDSSGNNYCGTDCSAGQACPSSASCQQILDQNNNVVGSNCFPTSGYCVAQVGGSSSSGGSSTTTSQGTTGGAWTSGGSNGGGSSSGGSSSGGSTSTTAAQCTPDTWSNFAQSFFNNNCGQCHSQFSSYSSVVSDAKSITSKISNGSMPQGSSLSASDKS